MRHYAEAPDLLPGDTVHQQAVRAFVMGRNTLHSRLDAIDCLQRMAKVLGYEDMLSCPWQNLSPSDCATIRTRLQRVGMKPISVNGYIIVLRGLAKHALDSEIGDAKRWEAIRKTKRVACDAGDEPGRLVRDDEVLSLLQATEDSGEKGIRDRFMVGLFWASGLRVSSVISLTFESVTLQGEGLTVRSVGKGNKQHTLTLHGQVVKAFEEYIAVRGTWPGVLLCGVSHGRPPHRLNKHPLTVSGVRKILVKLAERAGIEHFSPHDFRRTFVTSIIDAHGLRTAQLCVAHSSPAITARYDRGGRQRIDAAMMTRTLPSVTA